MLEKRCINDASRDFEREIERKRERERKKNIRRIFIGSNVYIYCERNDAILARRPRKIENNAKCKRPLHSRTFEHYFFFSESSYVTFALLSGFPFYYFFSIIVTLQCAHNITYM